MPVGLHSDESAPMLGTPPDPPAQPATAEGPRTQTSVPPSEHTQPPNDTPHGTDHKSDDEKGTNWWGQLWNKFEDLKNWAGGVADAVKGNHPESESE
jgi:hypothetical protein